MGLEKIITPYLFTGLDVFVGIFKFHHFKFYLKNNKPFVQTENYARDSNREPANGYQCLNELLERGLKLEFAKTEEATEEEMRTLK